MVELLLERDLLTSCLAVLPGVLQGTESAIPVMFPLKETEGTPSAHKFYEFSKHVERGSTCLAASFEKILEGIKKQVSGWKREELRILEVGAGTGSATRRILPVIQAADIPYSYTYTDISPAFFKQAEKEFGAECVNFKVLNLEEDPLAQGFAPSDFHIVIASMVLHATRDLEETLRNLRILTKPRGILLFFEGTKNTRLIDLTFGLLDGYWRFNDFSLRPHHCLINEAKWDSILSSCGFASSLHLNVNGDIQTVCLAEASSETPIHRFNFLKKKWIIFLPGNKPQLGSKLVELFSSFNREVIQIVKNEDENTWLAQLEGELEGIAYLWGLLDTQDQAEIAKPFLSIIQKLIRRDSALKKLPRLVMVTEGVVSVKPAKQVETAGPSPIGPAAGTLWGMARNLRTEHPTFSVRSVDIDPEIGANSERKIFDECFRKDGEAQVAYRKGKRHVLRLQDIKKDFIRKWEPLELPQITRFGVVRDRDISSLRFESVEKPDRLDGTELEIQVKAFGLNFKDVMCWLAPDEQFKKEFVLGMDLTGIVQRIGPDCSSFKVGDAVVGVNMREALPSHFITTENKVIHLPAQFTFTDGATLPLVFGTAYHSLVEVARLQKGETVLIHCATGGVGLAALQIAKRIGATVIASAGNSKKREYLKTIGIRQVFDSRSADFPSEIQGVDVVLNSLTGPGFKEATLRTCAPNARFVEMSKINIWTTDEVKKERPDVQYSIVDMSHSDTNWEGLMEQLTVWLKSGWVEPLPRVRFNAVHIQQALKYLQEGKHIGKVVVTMPEVNDGQITNHGLFNDKSTYLITGGLGGIGFELCKWMLGKGARHVVLCGRRDTSQPIRDKIQALQKSGSNVIFMKADVGNFEDCKRILNEIKISLPPLRGVMHLACSFSNAAFETTNWARYEKTFNSKINGAWNLHQLTEELRLDHFVLFSSIMGLIGGVGQSNYAAENAYLDSLAQWRKSKGLPATTIDWGMWAQIGVVAHLEHPILRGSSSEDCFNTLELVLNANKGQAVVFDAKMGELATLLPPSGQSYLKDIVTYNVKDKGSETNKLMGSEGSSSDAFWLKFQEAEEGLSFVEAQLSNVIRTILKHDPNEPVNCQQSFSDVGVDSLMNFEFKNSVQNLIGKEVEVSLDNISENSSVNALAKFILRQKNNNNNNK